MIKNVFVTQAIKTTLLSGAFLFPFLAQKLSAWVLWGIFLGVLLSLANIYFLSRLFNILFLQSGPSSARPAVSESAPLNRFVALFYKTAQPRGIIYLLLFKFPVFYGVISGLVYGLNLPPYAIMMGFSFPLMVIVLKMVGQIAGKESPRISPRGI